MWRCWVTIAAISEGSTTYAQCCCDSRSSALLARAAEDDVADRVFLDFKLVHLQRVMISSLALAEGTVESVE